jgi:hypothetical protein
MNEQRREILKTHTRTTYFLARAGYMMSSSRSLRSSKLLQIGFALNIICNDEDHELMVGGPLFTLHCATFQRGEEEVREKRATAEAAEAYSTIWLLLRSALSS